MVIGVLSNAAAAETLLNNLAEADFNLADVSVLMRDEQQRAAIADDTGPLKGTGWRKVTQRLAEAGVAHSEAQQYAEAIDQGKVFVAIAASKETEPVAQEMLHDHAAHLIRNVS